MPPLIIHTETTDQQSGVSRVNKEIADLIARKDPVLNRVNKKQKLGISKQKKNRMEAKMIKAAEKAVWILSTLVLTIGSTCREDCQSSTAREGDQEKKSTSNEEQSDNRLTGTW